MAPPAENRFLFTVCQVGSERMLKAELARDYPTLHPAFGRPGLVTWKSTAGPIGPDFELHSVFARAYGAALGPARTVEEAVAIAARIGEGNPLRLHVFERDPIAAAEENGRAAEIRASMLAAPGIQFLDGERAEPGDRVVSVAVAGDEPLFLGHHLHASPHSPWPGGLIPVEMPPEAPSRAYRKLEEALAWSGAPVRRGQVAIEIGSAPGGASYALLRRGLDVVGVDPGAMSPVVLASPRFRHVQAAIADARLADHAARADWLVLDVNLAPQIALRAVRGLASALRPSLRGVLFTLKLNDLGTAARIPELLRRVLEMGMTEVRATQLPSNRQEVFVYGRSSADL